MRVRILRRAREGGRLANNAPPPHALPGRAHLVSMNNLWPFRLELAKAQLLTPRGCHVLEPYNTIHNPPPLCSRGMHVSS